MSKFKSLKVSLGIGLALIALQALSVVPANAQVDIYVLGRPGSTFSPHSARNLEEMKDLFDRFEDDLRIVLDKGGWSGNADDVFTTMRAAQEGDGTVTKTTIAPGHTLKWMANRKGGEPSVIMNPRWAAKEPMPAWKILVESNGSEYTFIVPVSCMNLALDSSRAMPKPTCNIKATYDPAVNMITVTGSSDGEFKITDASLPSGKASVSDLKSTGPTTWTFTPEMDGTYSFNAQAEKDGQTVTCTTSVLVGKPKAACAIDVTVDPETHMISIDTSRSTGDFEMTGVTLPDGTAVDVAALQSTGATTWTYDPSESLKRKPADYTYTFAGKSTLYGSETTCDTAAIIRVEAPEYRFVVRGMYEGVFPSSDFAATTTAAGAATALAAAASPFESMTHVSTGGGNGFGLELEWLVLPNIGLEIGGLWSSFETEFMYDTADIWLMDTDDADFNAYTFGGNYHFTPDKRVDFFAGAFIGLVSYGTTSYRLLDSPSSDNFVPQSVKINWDDDFTYGLRAGLDIPFKAGSPFVATLGVRWFHSKMSQKSGLNHELDVNPWTGSIGIGYRF